MHLDDYLVDGEKVVTGTSAYEDRDAISDDQKGNLACTTNRVVFVRKNNVIDISLNAVNSVEYNSPSYPTRYALIGIAEIIFAALIYISPSFSNLLTQSDAQIGAMVMITLGVATMALGLLFRRGILKLHTPNKTYEFAASNDSLQDIVHALRGYEHKK